VASAQYTDEAVELLMQRLSNSEDPIALTKGERLMLVNLRPVDYVDLVACVDEVNERFDNHEKLLRILHECLPLPEPVEETFEENT
jgi:hypothetical protein